MTKGEDRTLISPATTPGSIRDESYLLVPRSSTLSPSSQLPWYKKYPPPYALLTASLLQIIIFVASSKTIERYLRFEPNNKQEAWRFLTYMLLHDSWFHLSLNLIIQCLFAAALEKKQGHLRVAVLYLGGGAVGALGAACVRPDLVIGASAGVYALLTSHISHVILNFRTIKYRLYRCVSVLIIVTSDVCYNLVHFYYSGDPIISWGAHAVGAVTGFVLALALYKNVDESSKGKSAVFFWIGIVLFAVLLTFLFVIAVQIGRCTPKEFLAVRYAYSC